MGRSIYRVHSDRGRSHDWESATTWMQAEDWGEAMDATESLLDGHAVSSVYEREPPEDATIHDAEEVL